MQNLLEISTAIATKSDHDTITIPISLMKKILSSIDSKQAAPLESEQSSPPLPLTQPKKASFADVVKRIAPNQAHPPPNLSAPNGQPKLKLFDKKQAAKTCTLQELVNRCSTTAREERFSPLCTRHYTGISRRPISEIRAIMQKVGVNMSRIKNITFVGDKVMEVITFENYAIDFKNILADARKMDGCEKFIVNEISFLPESYDGIKCHGMEKSPQELLKNRLKRVLENLIEREKIQPSLRRTIRFVELCIRTGSVNPSLQLQSMDSESLPDSQKND
jgi:hypothetical protein